MTLNERIKKFYEQTTMLWLNIWGEHMHQGYYGNNNPKEKKNFAKAQEDLLEELLAWGEVTQADQILDAGCGVGGTARFLAKKFNAQVVGITLSPLQAEKGQQYSKLVGLDQSVTIIAGDMMKLKSSSQKFDLICAIESVDYIEDKAKLLAMFYNLLNPGGRLLIAGWFQREESPILVKSERVLLDKICSYFHFSPMTSLKALGVLAQENNFTKVSTADWSKEILPFWKVKSTLRLTSLGGLFRLRIFIIKGVWALWYMRKGYRSNLIRYGAVQGTKL
jgi:tocopherol O-methyltransferase